MQKNGNLINVSNNNVNVWQGGNKVKNFNDYHYMSSVNLNNNKSLYDSHFGDSHFGGATFISHNFLLTASHIITNKDGNIIKPDSIKIAYGGLDLKKESDFQIFKVKAVYRYSDYFVLKNHENMAVNDVGLIEIENHPKIPIKAVNLVNKITLKD